MSQLSKSLLLSALILAVAIPASAMIGLGSTNVKSNALVRISGNTASLTSIVRGANSGKAAAQGSKIRGNNKMIFRVKG